MSDTRTVTREQLRYAAPHFVSDEAIDLIWLALPAPAPTADGVRTVAGQALLDDLMWGEQTSGAMRLTVRSYVKRIEAEAALPAAGLDVDDVRAALHRAGIGCKPNIPYCRATHRGHAQRIVDELIARLRGGA